MAHDGAGRDDAGAGRYVAVSGHLFGITDIAQHSGYAVVDLPAIQHVVVIALRDRRDRHADRAAALCGVGVGQDVCVIAAVVEEEPERIRASGKTARGKKAYSSGSAPNTDSMTEMCSENSGSASYLNPHRLKLSGQPLSDPPRTDMEML